MIERFVLHAHAALERLAIAQNLEEINERFQQAVRTTMDGFWSYGPDNRLHDVNQAYCQMSGYTQRQLIGMHISELEVRDTPEEIDTQNRRIIARGQDLYVSQHRRSDGSLYDVEVSVSYLPADGGRFSGFIRDITERRQAQDRILRLNADLEERVSACTQELSDMNMELMETNTELERATLAKSSFLASMSHELRTPLNSIIGFTGIMLQGLAGPVSDEQATQLTMVSQSGKHLLSLINDVLDLSKIEAGSAATNIEDIDLRSLVQGIRGIGSSDLPHIMESFYQADQPDWAKSPGTGLGLTISSQLAATLGGSLSVESELGVGSTFTLRIPKSAHLTE